MTMNILDLNEEGDYSPVELKEAKNTSIGGTYQLNQGQTRKIQVSVQKVRASGNIELGSIHNVEIGSMYARSIQDDQLDSFQEIDFNTMKDKWEHKLLQRRDYLDGEMQELMDKKDKNSEDLIKESKLNDEWLVLQHERNILVHSDFHEIIGSSINWKFPVGYEPRAPILFINTDDKQMLHQSGYLLGEDDKYIILKFKHGTLSKLDAIATWGLNDHEDRHLQSITSQKERVYIILRVTVALKHPPSLKIILRKRLMLRIIKKETVFFNPFPFSSEKIRKSGVVYEIFCGLPHMEGLPIHIDLHPSILEPNEGESLVDTFQREMKEISDQLQLDQWKQELSLTEQLSKAGIIQLGYPSSDSLGLRIRNSSLCPDYSRSLELPSIPDAIPSPTIHQQQSLPAVEAVTDICNNICVDQLTPPNSPYKAVQSSFSYHINNKTDEVISKPENTELVSKDLNPGVLVSSLTKDSNPDFEQNEIDLPLNVKLFPSDDISPENFLKPDTSPVENPSKKFSSHVKQVKAVSREPAQHASNSLPSKAQVKTGRSYTVPDIGSPAVCMKRKSFPMPPGIPDFRATKVAEVGFKLNDRVLVELKAGSKVAKVRYIGQFHYGKENETWVGLQLTEPAGKNNGTVDGIFYFKCKDKHGSFVPISKVLTVLGNRNHPKT